MFCAKIKSDTNVHMFFLTVYSVFDAFTSLTTLDIWYMSILYKMSTILDNLQIILTTETTCSKYILKQHKVFVF